ncbi:MAG TPA: STAS domain-containing protein [Dokdonella sp.]
MSEALRIERTGAGQVRIAGVVGFEQAAAAFGRGGELLDDGAADVTVDVSGLRDVDSATLALLLAWAAEAARRNVRLHLAAVPDDLKALAHLCDAEPLLGIA